ncbi:MULTISPECIES: hypothetical protein [Aneurinibacillus]|jgi:hypothetical protein|uniref:Lipoprotein n=1 Tax=Aneurinibacillus thermoaerophilus TaxID=143495 RepID=A0ABX8YFV5_ANETH|nr:MULTISPECIES: hypothetical protein [Aneurinibacillus]AMA73216.1 hypothetical protein ACH33_10325 [Aneurinibacillus sp. XH2]MED0674360.1 hypothetical protein [Aneurinibacillus thermoaerophilus]MED0678379.1 hypothetical protein [Aneurinibacillus thermoaerophilus]MED0736097.1 hypothetical protein [Aneurinibacillus thermoaerophilus]MED0756941.1 hypothetical protein [Aneurinibacillus thermoaerophilus]
MKQRIWICCFLLIALVAAGCTERQEKMVYLGESKNWKAMLTAIHTPGSDKETQVLRLSYKSPDIDSVYDVSYTLAGVPREIKGSEDNMNNKSAITRRIVCQGCKLAGERDTFTLTVEWSPNRKEMFTLKFIRKE